MITQACVQVDRSQLPELAAVFSIDKKKKKKKKHQVCSVSGVCVCVIKNCVPC